MMSTPGGEGYVQEVRNTLGGLNVKFEDMGDHRIGAVIATHTGPGTIGAILEPLTA